MRCPFCAETGPDEDRSIRRLHAHLADQHADRVRFDDLGERSAYAVVCPYCEEQYRQPMRKSAGDAEFLREHGRQIRLVAFDMLINHLLAEHEPEYPVT